MAEEAQRLASLVVVGGPLKDRRYDLEEVVAEVLIGSDPDCHLHVDLPGISPIHARLWTDLNRVTVYDTHAPRGVFVNDDKVTGEASIHSGDWLWLGPPTEPDSACIQCRFEAWAEVLPEAGVPTEEAAEAGAPPVPAGSQTPPLDAYEPGVLIDETVPEVAGEPVTGPTPPLEAYEPGVLIDESAPKAAGGSVTAPTSADEQAAPPSAEPGLEALLPEPPEAPPDRAAIPAAREEEPLFVEAEPTPPEAPAPAVAAQPKPAPAPAPAPAPEEAPAPAEARVSPPPDSPSPAFSAEDPFFVGGEVPAASEKSGTTLPDTPPDAAVDDPWSIPEPPPTGGAPAGLPEAPAEDHFFIAEDVLTTPAPSSPSTAPEAPAEDAPFVLAEPVLLPPTEPTPGGGASSRPADATGQAASGAPAPERLDPVPPVPPGPGAGPTMDAPVVADEVPPRPVPSPAPAPAQPPAATALPDDVLVATEAPPSGAPVAPTAAPPGRPAPRRPRPPSAGPRTPAAGARRPVRSRAGRRGAPEWLRPVGLGAGAALVLGVIGIALVTWLGGSVSVDEVSPARLRVGQRAVLTGAGFSEDPARNTVLFGGVTATIVSASKTRLEVEVPEAVAEAGAERRVPVVVRKGRLESEPLEVSVFQGPVLHGLSPDAAMPGEEVILAGAGWGIGATVRFGDVAAGILEVDTTQIRVTVPPLPGGYGTSAPVVVTVGGVESNPAPFFVGRLPLITGLRPAAVSMGDVVTVSGRGFESDPGQNDVRLAGVRALVVSASGEVLTVVVPRLAPGDPARSVEIRVPGSQDVGQGVLEVAAAPDPIGLRFVAEPFEGPSAHPHAVLSTGLGPALVLAAADGRSAAERALAAQQALNGAVATLAGSPGLLPEARDVQTQPVLGLPGQFQALVEVTEADAAAYNEDWTRLRGRARAVTPARLARWWEAVVRDLVLMLVRAEPPRFAAALASEGRAFQEVFDAAQRAGGAGVSAEVVAGLRRGTRDGLSVIALRVPPSVVAEVPTAAGATAAATPTPAPAPKAEPLRLDGSWTGTESDQGRQRYVTVTFRRDYGSIAYEGGLTLTVPFLKLERPGRDRVRFTVQIRGGIRHYLGSWDGETLAGNIARDEAGRDVVGTFELRPR